MGVDIYGKRYYTRDADQQLVLVKKWVNKKPEMDWDSDAITEVDKKNYFDALDKFEKDNPGHYFRSNWWSWRPIVMLCIHSAEQYGLDYKFEEWMNNDGLGLENNEECNIVADTLEKIIDEETSTWFTVEQDDVIYCNMNSWSTKGGGMVDDTITEKLNEDYPYGTIMFTSVVAEDGNIYNPSHGTPLWLIKEFIEFLRNCGGFYVY